jgi:hypothetical protein
MEVLLAATLGAILMAALYAAVHIQLHSTKVGRDKVERSALARTLLSSMAHDISPNLGPLSPTNFRTGGGAAGAGGGAGGGAAQAGGASSSSSSSSSSGQNMSGSSGVGSSPMLPAASLSGPVTFNLGVQGDQNRLVLYVSRVPREVNVPANSPEAAQLPLVSDLRRVTYWRTDGGLCRQEIKVATTEDAVTYPPADIPNDPSLVIAEEVKGLNFEYWDGTAWQESWDGTVLGSDGQTPIGPPIAIAITIEIVVPSEDAEDKAEPKLLKYRHVVPIRTANGATQQQLGSSSTGSQ